MLKNLSLENYIDTLASDAPAPGGGSAAALSGAQGIALVAMVANLTCGKEKYAQFEELNQKVLKECSDLKEKFIISIDKDTDAFNEFSAALKMPKETDEDKAKRSVALTNATLVATEVPFETIGLALLGLSVCGEIVGKSNQNASSDLGVAALNLLASVKSAWLNVLINVPGIKDIEMKDKFVSEGNLIVNEAEKLANSIYEEIKNNL